MWNQFCNLGSSSDLFCAMIKHRFTLSFASILPSLAIGESSNFEVINLSLRHSAVRYCCFKRTKLRYCIWYGWAYKRSCSEILWYHENRHLIMRTKCEKAKFWNKDTASLFQAFCEVLTKCIPDESCSGLIKPLLAQPSFLKLFVSILFSWDGPSTPYNLLWNKFESSRWYCWSWSAWHFQRLSICYLPIDFLLFKGNTLSILFLIAWRSGGKEIFVRWAFLKRHLKYLNLNLNNN